MRYCEYICWIIFHLCSIDPSLQAAQAVSSSVKNDAVAMSTCSCSIVTRDTCCRLILSSCWSTAYFFNLIVAASGA